MSQIILEVDGLLKRYGSLLAVDGVSFRVAAGEIFGLLGPNGAGKTTTLGCICGLLAQDGGAVRIGGVDAKLDPSAIRRTWRE